MSIIEEWSERMNDRIKNLGKYAHKPKHVDVGKSEDDMSSKRVNTKLPERGQRTKTNKMYGGGGVRG